MATDAEMRDLVRDLRTRFDAFMSYTQKAESSIHRTLSVDAFVRATSVTSLFLTSRADKVNDLLDNNVRLRHSMQDVVEQVERKGTVGLEDAEHRATPEDIGKIYKLMARLSESWGETAKAAEESTLTAQMLDVLKRVGSGFMAMAEDLYLIAANLLRFVKEGTDAANDLPGLVKLAVLVLGGKLLYDHFFGSGTRT